MPATIIEGGDPLPPPPSLSSSFSSSSISAFSSSISASSRVPPCHPAASFSDAVAVRPVQMHKSTGTLTQVEKKGLASGFGAESNTRENSAEIPGRVAYAAGSSLLSRRASPLPRRRFSHTFFFPPSPSFFPPFFFSRRLICLRSGAAPRASRPSDMNILAC